jgi:putative restriction endonuclease
MLPPLLRKAAGDAGFDLTLGSDGEWERLGVSGLSGSAWVVPVRAGALLALDSAAVSGDFQTVTWTDVPLPAGAAGALRCETPAELYEALRRVRVLFSQTPPLPQRRFEQRLRAITTTEVDALVRQRVGQGLFREMLLEYWDGRCAVTGLAVSELLRASHAKPWKDSTDAERLDVHNGFMLAFHLDALFDQGWVTFRDDGLAVFSPALPAGVRELLLGERPIGLSRVGACHLPYLAHHRQHVFRASTARLQVPAEPLP